MAKGKGLKGQKWDKYNQCWYFPEGYVPEIPKTELPKETMVSMEVVEQLLSKRDKEFNEKLEKVKSENHAQVIDARQYAPIDKTEIPDEDLLDKPVFYYAWGRALTLSGYVLKGRAIKPPYARPIKLQRLPPDITFNERGDRVELEKCSTLDGIWSKREIKFIEESLQFKGGIIMKDMAGLKQEDAAMQNIRMQAMANVSKMTQAELITNCRNRQITGTNNDFSAMQMKLIESLCKEYSGSIRNSQADAVTRSNKELEGTKI